MMRYGTVILPFERAVGLVRARVGAVTDACAAVGRDPATLRRLLVTGVSVGGVLAPATAFEQAAGLFGAAGISDLVVHRPRLEFPYEASSDVLEDIGDRVLLARSGAVSD